eukprot:1157447-Pelagomonas_calceolata.AAC.4
MACIYNCYIQGKCVDVMSPGRCQILYRASYRAKLAGMHEKITPAPTNFASEPEGLLFRKTFLENKYRTRGFTRGLQWWPTARDSG